MSWLKDIRRHIRYRWIYKTHQLTSTLPKGQWYDYDQRLLYCAFDGLVEFVERETTIERLEWAARLSEEHRHQARAAQETLALYRWWTKVRLSRHDPYAGDGFHENHDETSLANARMERGEEEDTEMLIRLVRVRGSLWT